MAADKKTICDAWNPGITSTIPPHLASSVTLYRPENGLISYADAVEAARLCGLPTQEMSILRVERLIIHELLLRVTSDLSVPDGPNYADLGISLRSMVDQIYRRHIMPDMAQYSAEFDHVKNQIRAQLDAILIETKTNASSHSKHKEAGNKWLGRWFRFLGFGQSVSLQGAMTDEDQLALWQEMAKDNHDDACAKSCYAALAKLAAAIIGQQGRLISDHGLLVDLASRLVIHDYGAHQIRRLIAPAFEKAANSEGYRFLPAQSKPVVMNTKGASAAGKSTLRPKQRQLAAKLNTDWEDYALISPDYWRKYLLDYDSLGEDFKYAAMLTGHELVMIDRKLDGYMAEKAVAGTMPHLLVDRFRFDSFNTSAGGDYQSSLLTRFGHTVYLFFVITAPQNTVERAWLRGLTTQRYKAVDDLLYHNIEAFNGIPNLFLSWAQVRNKTIYFEFLDNDQPLNAPPRTIAFGLNNMMTVLDPVALCNIDRYRNVNIDAKSPDEVLQKSDDPYRFLTACANALDQMTFADFHSAKVYGQMKSGQWVYHNDASRPDTTGLLEVLEALHWSTAQDTPDVLAPVLDVKAEHNHTLGLWAEET
jgi:hypothetical protein